MSTAFRSGTRNATRRTWRIVDRSPARPGPYPRPRPNPFDQLAAGMECLIRFHKSHPDWFPPVPPQGSGSPPTPVLPPEWEAAIHKAYHPEPPVTAASPGDSGSIPANPKTVP